MGIIHADAGNMKERVELSLMQEKLPPEYSGKIFGLYGSLTSAAMLLGLVTTGCPLTLWV